MRAWGRLKKLVAVSIAILVGLGLAIGLGWEEASSDAGVQACVAEGLAGGDLRPAPDPLPPVGDCRWTGRTYKDNPFSGWPMGTRVCDESVIGFVYCEKNYFPGYEHWGIDFGYIGIEGVSVLVTTDHAVVFRVKGDYGWNSGMGNYVFLRALDCSTERADMCCLGEDCVRRLDPLTGMDGLLRPCGKREIETCEETGWRSAVMHLGEVMVSLGERIERGDVIGYVGGTGNVTGPHLHYEIMSPRDHPGGAIDPLPTLCDW